MSVERTDLAPGTRVAGRYVVEACVRSGPIVSVYVARAETATAARFMARVVQAGAGGADVVGAVNREMQRVSMLRQRAIPSLTAVARDPAGLVVVTERPEGSTLREALKKSGRLRSSEVGRLLLEVAAVLDSLHVSAPAIVHRAITPDNISMTDRMLRVWIEECGLAHALTAAGLLPPGAPFAPASYRSPDEFQQRVSTSTDLFALASVTYECLTGAAAFPGPNDAAIEAAVVRGPRPATRAVRPELPEEVDAVLQRAWSGQGIYATAGAFARELARVLAATPSNRGVPAVGLRAKAPTPGDAPRDSRPSGAGQSSKSTLLGMVAPLIAGGDPRATLIGVGVAGLRTRPTAPRSGGAFGPPVSPGAALGARESAAPAVPAQPAPPAQPAAPAQPAPAGSPELSMPPGTVPSLPMPTEPMLTTERPLRRGPQGVTMKVEVPRTRAPGTERAEPPLNKGRATGAESVVPPAPKDVAPAPEAPPAAPVVVPRLPSQPPSESTQPWGVVEASLGLEDDPRDAKPGKPAPAATVELSPSLQPPPPSEADAFGVMTADSLGVELDDESDAPAGVEAEGPRTDPAPPPSAAPTPFDPASASGQVSFLPPPLAAAPSVDAAPEVVMPVVPALPEVPMPVEPMSPLSIPPPLPAVGLTPAVEAPPFVPVSTRDVAHVQPSVPAWAALPSPPDENPLVLSRRARFRVARIVAACVGVAALGVGAFVGYQRAHPPADPTPRVLPAPTRGAVPPAAALDGAVPMVGSADASVAADAAVAAAADATVVMATDAAVAAAREDAAPTATDAAVVVAVDDASVARADDAAVAAVNDASAGDDRGEPATAQGLDRLHHHPHASDLDDLEVAMEPAVQACITDNHHRRHVRVAVTYAGTTGQPTEIHIGSAYAEPPVGPCIEAVIRAHPLAPFTDDTYDTHYSFESR